jgi:hypothetical protein
MTHTLDNTGKAPVTTPGTSLTPNTVGNAAANPQQPGAPPGSLPPGMQPRPGVGNAMGKQLPPPPPAKRPPPKKDKDQKDNKDR